MRGALTAALLSACLFVLLAHSKAHHRVEALTYDARVRWTAKPNADPSIIIIDIDDASFETMKQRNWRWPWTRVAWTETVKHVSKGKPRVIVFDAIFGGSESEKVDSDFATALQGAGNVVLGYAFSQTRMDLTDATPVQERWKLLDPEGSIDVSGVTQSIDPKDWVLDIPAPNLVHAAAGMGSITAGAFDDSDGTVRRVALQFVGGNRAFRSLSLRAADLTVGNSNMDARLRNGEFLFRQGQRPFPVDDSGNLILVWHRNPRPLASGDLANFAYERIPIWQVFCSMPQWNCPPEVKRFPPEYFQNKIVLIGASAAAAYDAHPTPFKSVAPGVLAHATAIDNLIHGEAVRPAVTSAGNAIIVMFALLGAVLLTRISSTGRAALIALIAAAGYLWFAVAIFGREHYWLPVVAPLSSFAVSFVASGAVRYATTGRELRRTRGTLDRYVAPQLVDYVLGQIDHINFAGEKKELTIFFSDVRNFTTLTEGTPPMELIALLNEYLAAMTEIVFKYEGIVDKFIGDGILAYWGAFTSGRNHALLAAQASLEMLERLKELNLKWASEGRKQLAIGIGLNSGEVIFGNVGAGKKVEFTVIGDAVNLAARLESLNKEYRTSIIISEFTLTMLGNAAVVEPLGGVMVKGKTIETQIYELQALTATPATVPAAAAKT